MATENRKHGRLIEDWGSISTAVVIPDGQSRWYDGVTGYQPTEVIELIGDGSTTIASLLKRQPITDAAQNMYGVKTFDDIPVLPSTTPTSDNQAANKKYVDDEITGSLGFPAGFIYGLETAPDTDADHDVTISVGKCRDYADSTDLELSSAMTKQIDASWAAGTAAGGLFTGTVAADTTYHLFVIKKDSDDSIDAGWDTDIDCANIPLGYTEYRRLASYETDSSSNIRAYRQDGDDFYYDEPVLDVAGVAQSSGVSTTHTLSMPSGVYKAILAASATLAGGCSIAFFHPDQTTFTPSTAPSTTRKGQLVHRGNPSAGSVSGTFSIKDSQVVTVSSSTATLTLETWGYVDTRGRFGGK